MNAGNTFGAEIQRIVAVGAADHLEPLRRVRERGMTVRVA
jgi:hypothetical protein